jgi:dipeptidyl aminopeptidase/acylaminoacyl peptidase
MIPLIDRELFFGNPEITSASLSPDGKYLAFVKPWKDTLNVWVKKREEPFELARLLTAEVGRPIADYLWTRDGKYIVYVKDKDGDENYNVYAVDPGASPAEGGDAPTARDLTGLEGVQVNLYSAPKYEPDIVYIGLNDRDKAWHDLYRLHISTGKRELMRKNTEQVAGWFFDLKGNLRLAFRVADNGDQEILRVDPKQLTRVYSCSVFESCEPLRFHPDGRRVYLETNKGDDVDLTRLVLFDPATGETEPVESDPLGRVDFGGCGFHEVTDELIYTSYEDDKVRRYFRDKEFEADFHHLEEQLPGKEVFFESRTSDDRLWVVSADSDVEPGETYIFDRQTRKLDFQFRIREKLRRDWLAEMQPLRYKSSDGLEIPAYLSLPRGVEAKNVCPGHTQVIACLPLEEGYSAVFRNFDVQKQKPKAMRLEVKGSEEIEVPAGRFDCFRLELTSAEGGSERSTIWVSKEDRLVVKLSAIMLELAGARMEAELWSGL